MKKKNPAAVAFGRIGGLAQNARKGFGSLNAQQRSELGKKAALARWGKVKKKGMGMEGGFENARRPVQAARKVEPKTSA